MLGNYSVAGQLVASQAELSFTASYLVSYNSGKKMFLPYSIRKLFLLEQLKYLLLQS
jgi:hypothetical protein